VIDAHVHVWDLSRRETLIATRQFPVLAGRAFLPADLERMLNRTGASAAVLVHGPATAAHTDFCLALSGQHPFILAVVGWIDVRGADPVGELTDRQRTPTFRGIRLTPLLDDDPEGYLSCAGALALAQGLSKGAGVLEVLATPELLPAVGRLCDAAPDTDVVIAHFGLPDPARPFVPWAGVMAELAGRARVHVKLAGPPLTSRGSGADRVIVRPYLQHLLEHFGAGRLLYASNWPVMTALTTPRLWHHDLERLLDGLTREQRRAVFGDNARRLYEA